MTERTQPRDIVRQRLGNTSQEPQVCVCDDCRAYDVTQPPVWVPTRPEQREGRWVAMVEQLHGWKLQQHLRAVADYERALAGIREKAQFRSQR